MRILVTHLTRMHNGHICVAGIDRETCRHVRPVLRDVGIPNTVLAVHGGPFSVSAVVDVGEVGPCGQAPEVEDCFFVLENVRNVGAASDEELWALLSDLRQDSLRDIFGEALTTPAGFERSLVTPEGQGIASLGVWRPEKQPRLALEGEKLRVRCEWDGREKSLSLTDVRFYEPDMVTPDMQALKWWRGELAAAEEVLLCVGLGRPWAPQGSGLPRMHWLQVNGVHARTGAPVPRPAASPLMKQLKSWRYGVAQSKGLPAYCVMSNLALESVDRDRPTTLAQLQGLKGFGPKTVAEYGEAVLEIVRRVGDSDGARSPRGGTDA